MIEFCFNHLCNQLYFNIYGIILRNHSLELLSMTSLGQPIFKVNVRDVYLALSLYTRHLWIHYFASHNKLQIISKAVVRNHHLSVISPAIVRVTVVQPATNSFIPGVISRVRCSPGSQSSLTSCLKSANHERGIRVVGNRLESPQLAYPVACQVFVSVPVIINLSFSSSNPVSGKCERARHLPFVGTLSDIASER